MPNLVGIGNSQVPTNGMLGGLAYQDSSVLDQVRSGRKNMIINGAMNICQRFAVNTANNISNATHTYHVDRFKAYESTDAILQGEWLNSDAPSGFYNSLFYHPVGTDTTLANEQFGFISQVIELNNMRHLGYGGSYAKTCTLSFYVKSNVTGTFCIALLNDGTNNRGFVTEYTIDSANTWERKVITIPGDTSGTWSSNGLRIAWTLVSSGNRHTTTVGSWFTDSTVRYATNKQVNFMSSASNSFKITGVQFETGNYATDFEHRSYAEELKLCQRYYAIFHPCTQAQIYIESGGTATHSFWEGPVPQGMRAEPSVTLSGTWTGHNIAGGRSISAVAVQGIDNGGNAGTTHPGSMGAVSLRVTRDTSGTYSDRDVVHHDGWGNGNAWIAFESEL
tara:strand:+ start:637 stop:1812 length:1176 start_codon:yes stop_codon:yes gene_type:complete